MFDDLKAPADKIIRLMAMFAADTRATRSILAWGFIAIPQGALR